MDSSVSSFSSSISSSISLARASAIPFLRTSSGFVSATFFASISSTAASASIGNSFDISPYPSIFTKYLWCSVPSALVTTCLNQALITSLASAFGSFDPSSAKSSYNSSSPNISPISSVAAWPSSPAITGVAIISLNFATCSSLDGKCHVPSFTTESVHFSNSADSSCGFILYLGSKSCTSTSPFNHLPAIAIAISLSCLLVKLSSMLKIALAKSSSFVRTEIVASILLTKACNGFSV